MAPNSNGRSAPRVNRQQRRSATKQGQDGAPTTASPASLAEGLFNSARHLHITGQFAQAEALYRQALQVAPRHVDSMGFLGGLVLQAGRAPEAAELLGQALTLAPHAPVLHFNMAAAFRALGRPQDAVAHYKRSIQLQPNQPAAYNNMARALQDMGLLDDAAAAYDRALTLAPDPRVYCNLGNLRLEQGEFAGAAECYERAAALAPTMAEPPNGLGSALLRQDRPDLAVAPLQHAVSLRPNFVEAHNNLVRAWLGCGDPAAALAAVRKSLAIADTPEARELFVTCAAAAPIPADVARFAPLLHRALDERWGRPGDLAGLATQIAVRQEPLAGCIHRAEQAWPERLAADVFGEPGVAAIASDRLLCSLLEAAPVCDPGLERVLTNARMALLHIAAENAETHADELAFWCALAQQCCVNEHVFADTPQEQALVAGLRDRLSAALDSGADIPLLWPVAVAAYASLVGLGGAAGLPDRTWPAPVAALLTGQLAKP
jgi:tetratricopeptide (TPR) repeat protein